MDCIARSDLAIILSLIGGNPHDPHDTRPRRNRLIVELSFATGMRIDEIAALTLAQFLTLKQDPAHGTYPLLLTKTKGLVPRNVYIPALLYDALKTYVDDERAKAVGSKKCRALFVTHADANRNAGSPLSVRSISHAFHEAVMAAGLFKTIRDADNVERKIARHTFHDLRHTFAVEMYSTLKSNGETDPWLKLKVLLGHEHLRTTVNTYLRSIAALDANVSDAVNAALASLRKNKTTSRFRKSDHAKTQ